MTRRAPGTRRVTRLAALLSATLLSATLLLAGCAFVQTPIARSLERHIRQDLAARPFYTPPSPLPSAAPGTLIRSMPITTVGSTMKAWRVLYHSRDQNGADIAVSGTVVTPTTAAPAGGRPIVSWGHPTTGSAARCAPSSGIAPLDLIEGLGALIGAGYVVASTDYPGMGVDGPSSYLLGVEEGNSMLDAARAARQIPAADAGTRLLLWGHSQGGQAALFAGQQAASYAPELQLAAVAVAAPAADLGTLLNDHTDDLSGVTIGSYAFSAFQAEYAPRFPGLQLDSILTPAAAAATPAMAALCLFGQKSALDGLAKPLIGGYLAGNPATEEPWATMVRENSAGASPIPVPVLVAQGLKDALVKPTSTAGYVAQVCASGLTVRYAQFPKQSHGTIAFAATPTMSAWFRDAIAGTAPSGSCGGAP
jgi:pimeloyl-ACP methyl ester carboxylesterase